MPTIRQIASRLLSVIVQRSSAESRTWGNAMLRELDFIENDWSALHWALGSTTALFKNSLHGQLRIWFQQYAGQTRGPRLKNIRRTTATVFSGVIIAGSILTVCVYGLSRLMAALSPHWQSGHSVLAGWLPVLVVPETAYFVTAAALWRQRRTLAAGILLGALVLIVHVAIHILIQL
jgi:hypothetical protein